MPHTPHSLELLAPARNLEFGIEAIEHGADAVYIGGPSFGARAAAGNRMEDIAQLASHAHRYSARVLMTLNTILRDDELEAARQLAWQAYDAGVDALIVQDMGLLELDLPPLALHASTQTDNRSREKVQFLEQVGFSQIVLARELTLEQIRHIAAHTTATLEFFIHGALCVSYSGQCYLSHATTERSANRGECSQACRLPYSLADAQGQTHGQIIARQQHLLSLKDNNQSANLRALADAGIRSFKIEGRLKDLSYVKNVTAHYRKLLDEILTDAPNYQRASAGHCNFSFNPQPEKTFNRGASDYFVNDRQQEIADFRTPKFAGEAVGAVSQLGRDHFDIATQTVIHNGDGLTYFDARGELQGLRVNRADGQRLYPAEMPTKLQPGTALYRNRDQQFERQLEKKSAQRRIAVQLRLNETASGFALKISDEEGHTASANIEQGKEVAKDQEENASKLRENLGKFGNTIFQATNIDLQLSQPWFIPGSMLNALRRQAIEALIAARQNNYLRPRRQTASIPPPLYPENELSYLGNIYNQKARAFYSRHGVSLIEPAYECNQEKGLVSLMISKHCLRYSFNLCPKQVKGIRPEPMLLLRGNDKLTLRFDCQRCEMHVVGKLKIKRR